MFKRTTLIVIVGAILLIATSYIFFKDEILEPSEKIGELNKQSVNLSGKSVSVEIADEIDEQIQGLSGRDSLDSDAGMLFVFSPSSKPGFWMKDMNFSLDLIWIDEKDMVIAISKNISPDTYPQTYFPPSPVKYVLEVNAGWADKNKIKIGDKMGGI